MKVTFRRTFVPKCQIYTSDTLWHAVDYITFPIHYAAPPARTSYCAQRRWTLP